MQQPEIARKAEQEYRYPAGNLIVGDCLEVMRTMSPESVRLIVTSPPYNIKNSTGNGLKNGRGGKWPNAALQSGYDDHHDCMQHNDYVAWQRECLHWKHDTLINAFISKFRRLILVTGKKQKQLVNYEAAHFYSEPRQGSFIVAVADGTVAIDFDARTNNGSGIRNHGTKFRIKSENLRGLYDMYEEFTLDTK